ncbi:unnamed protein product [Caenorhabditis nigoni]
MKTLLLLLFLITQALGIMKMIQIFGKVTYGKFPVVYPSSENCASGCFNLYYCILSWKAHNGSCYHYSYLDRPNTITVMETDKTDGNKVGFKTNITGTSCPVSYTDMDFQMTIPNGDTYHWKKFGNLWSLSGCRDGWKQFDRADGISVCMKTFYFPARIYRWDARKKYCIPIGTDQIGVASVEESQWIHEQMMQYNPLKTAPFIFWTDGDFTQNCNDASYCESNKWADGYTTGNAALDTSTNFECKCENDMCPTVAYIPGNTTKTMSTVDCNVLGDGYVCGYNLKRSV